MKAKVLWIGEQKSVYSSIRKKELTKRDIIVADDSDVMIICLWESQVDQVQEMASYLFTDVKVCFVKKKYLNCTPRTVISVLPDEEDIYLPIAIKTKAESLIEEQNVINVVEGTIIGADTLLSYSCLNCKKRFTIEETTNSLAVPCPSCKLSSLKRNLPMHLSANVIIRQSNGSSERYQLPMAVLKTLFNELSKTPGYTIGDEDITQLSEEMVIETLLLLGLATFSINHEDRLIVSIKKGDTTQSAQNKKE